MTTVTMSYDALLSNLRRSRLISETQLRDAESRFRASGAQPEPQALIRFLVAEDLLTDWQGEKLLLGAWKGLVLGKYRLLRHLGSGGMSSVYLGEHLIMKRQAALKVLPKTKVEDSSFLERFKLEARAVASLDHPNIVKAYNVDNENETHYLVMEYVEGEDLEKTVKAHGPMDFRTAAECIRQAAEGLAHAHSRGMIHRDIKPSNLLKDRSGTVKILDMGLAKLTSNERSLTVEHNEKVLGTTDYLAPEQAIDSSQVDHRADIYALGCTLYFLLVGDPPFPTGSLAQRLLKHQVEQPKPISQFRPDVPGGLAKICSMMMAKKKQERIQTADKVARILKGYLESGEADLPSSTALGAETPTAKGPSATVALRDDDTDTLAATPKPPRSDVRRAAERIERGTAGAGAAVVEPEVEAAPEFVTASATGPRDGSSARHKALSRPAGAAVDRRRFGWIAGGTVGALAVGAGLWFAFGGGPVKGKLVTTGLAAMQELPLDLPRSGTVQFKLRVLSAESGLRAKAYVRVPDRNGREQPDVPIKDVINLDQATGPKNSPSRVIDLGKVALPAGKLEVVLQTLKLERPEGLTYSPWRVLGPFDWPPSKPGDLPSYFKSDKGQIDFGKSKPADVNGMTVWQAVDFPDLQVNDLVHKLPWGGKQNAYCYMYRSLASKNYRKIRFRFLRDNFLAVWLNGRQLIAPLLDVKNCEEGEEVRDGNLHAGTNHLLILLGNSDGSWRFAFSDGPSLENPTSSLPAFGSGLGPSFSYELDYEMVR